MREKEDMWDRRVCRKKKKESKKVFNIKKSHVYQFIKKVWVCS